MATATYNPSADTFISKNQATTNYGSENFFTVGESNGGAEYIRRGLVKYDVSALSGFRVFTSKLRHCIKTDRADSGPTVKVYRCLRDWVEGEAHWERYKSGSAWAANGGMGEGDYDDTELGTVTLGASESVDEYYEITLNTSGVAVVQAWVSGTYSNYGFLIVTSGELNDAYEIHSRSASEGYRPEMVNVYGGFGNLFCQQAVGL